MTAAGSISSMVEAAVGADRQALARLLTVVERGGREAREVAQQVHPLGGGAYTAGITGSPGTGKSTLTSGLVEKLRSDGSEVAVLAVDPSSPFTGGAILGDRVRMGDHALDPGVFIRSMATRGHLGGLALATPEAIRVLDAAAFTWIVVETVGVGQVEVEVAGAADTTIVVVNPGWGDAVQANKAGLLEIADVFVINKADRDGVSDTRRDLDHMLDLSSLGEWRPPIVETMATTGAGVGDLVAAIADHRGHLEADGRLAARRAQRLAGELRRIVAERIDQRAGRLCSGSEFDDLKAQVEARTLDPWAAADRLLEGSQGPSRSQESR